MAVKLTLIKFMSDVCGTVALTEKLVNLEVASTEKLLNLHINTSHKCLIDYCDPQERIDAQFLIENRRLIGFPSLCAISISNFVGGI